MTGPSAANAPRVRIVSAPDGSGVADAITARLTSVQVPLVSASTADVEVLVLTAGTIEGQLWTALSQRARVVVVKVDDVDVSSVPEAIRRINWLVWFDTQLAESFGRLLAAVITEPGEWQQQRRLQARAAEWREAGKPRDLLLPDVGRARAALRRAEFGGRQLDEAEGTYLEYLRTSAQLARRRRRRNGAATFAVLSAVLVAVISMVVAITTIRTETRNNKQLFITSNGPEVQQNLPEWQGLMSATLVLNGASTLRAAARDTLLTALQQPWSNGPIEVDTPGDSGYSIEDVAPLSVSDDALVAIGTANGQNQLGDYSISQARMTWRLNLHGDAFNIGLSADERSAVVAGAHVTEFVDLTRTRVISRVATPDFGEPLASRYISPGHAITVYNSGTVLEVGGAARSHLPGEPMALGPLRSGSATALVRRGPGSYGLYEVPSGRHIASAPIPEPVLTAGTVDPSGDSAYVLGGDHQVWQLGPGSVARPLGIPAADRDTAITALPGSRIVVGGGADRAHVYSLHPILDLGVVCRQTPQLNYVMASADGARIDCFGMQFNDLWPTPAGPSARPARLPVERTTADGLTLSNRNGLVGIVRKGATKRSNRIDLTDSTITAFSFAPDGSSVALGTAIGEVFVLDTASSGPHILSTQSLPSGTPVQALAWDGSALRAIDAVGSWNVWACSGCAHDSTLIALAKTRLASAGCWEQRNFLGIDADAQHRLNVHVCPRLPIAAG